MLIINDNYMYSPYGNIIKEKLGNNFEKIFKDLKKSIDDQKIFGLKIKKYLEDYGFFEHNQIFYALIKQPQ